MIDDAGFIRKGDLECLANVGLWVGFGLHWDSMLSTTTESASGGRPSERMGQMTDVTALDKEM